MKKTIDLLKILGIYLLAYLVGFAASRFVPGVILRFAVFDLAATVVTFAYSVLLKNSSVYDPYWSLTPAVMSVWLFVEAGAFSLFQILFLAVFNLWAIRLTVNWCVVFTDFSYEDWRYRKFREENPPALWQIINFFGIHLVPTVVVFLGMLPLFEIVKTPLGARSIPGMLVIFFGVALEFFADRQMHAFLKSATRGAVCDRGLWHISRHPNYLGEISVWFGVFFSMLPYAPEKWYTLVGALSVLLLFSVVSIPLAEKRQLSRRPAYAAYRKKTSVLLLLPPRR